MSKQTNAFQKVILYVHKKLEGEKAVVKESALVSENDVEGKIQREIDVLIEKVIDGKIFRIAIECRDRQIKDDIQWVDSLIGKYKNLDINKVIAVSNMGYSRSAQLKAKACEIELRSLDEVLMMDLRHEFRRLGIATVAHTYKLKSFSCELNPKTTPNLNWKVFYENKHEGSLNELFQFCYEEITQKKIMAYVDSNFREILPNRDDFNKTIVLEHKLPIKDLIVEASNGELHEVLSVSFLVLGVPIVEEVPVRHKAYGKDVLISEAKFNHDSIKYKLYAAQILNSAEGKFFFESKVEKDIQKDIQKDKS